MDENIDYKRASDAQMIAPDCQTWDVKIVRVKRDERPGIGLLIMFQTEAQAQGFLDDYFPHTDIEKIPKEKDE